MATMPAIPQLQAMESPVEQYGKWAALRSMIQQQQMQQQQMAYQQQMQPLQLQAEQSALRTQQLQQSLLENKVNDDKMLTDLWQQNGGDLDQMQTAVLAPDSRISAQGKLGWIQQRYELQKLHNQTSDEEAKLMEDTNKIAGPMLAQMDNASDQDLPALIGSYNAEVAAHPSLSKYMGPMPQGLDTIGARQWIKNQMAAHTTYEQLDKNRDYALKAGPLSNDEVANTNADSLLRWNNQNPGVPMPASLMMIPGKSTRLDQTYANEQLKQMETSAGQTADARYTQIKALQNQPIPASQWDPDGSQRAWAQAYEQRKTLVPQFKIDMRPSVTGGQAALANVPPHLVSFATTQATKAGEDYNKALSANQDMQSMINMARGGNVLSYAYAPVEGVLTLNTARGVTRVNIPEISGYGGAGSTWDRVMGWLGQHATGASIPGNVLNDMSAVHDQMATNARTKYQNALKIVNQNTGANFQPVDLGEIGGGGGGDQFQEGQTATGPNGHKIIWHGGQFIDMTTNRPLAR